MKIVILCLSLFTLFGANQGYAVERRISLDDPELLKDILKLKTSLQDPYDFKVAVNEFAEKIIGNLDIIIAKENLDPLPLGKLYEGYWWGHLILNNTEISGLSTLSRPNEDAMVYYEHDTKQVQLDLPLSFKNLKFSTDFKAKLLYVGPEGGITGEVSNLLMQTSLIIDFNVNQAFLRFFEITHSGHISIHIHANEMSDWLYNLISDAVTTIFKRFILKDVSVVVQSILHDLVGLLNEILQKLLG